MVWLPLKSSSSSSSSGVSKSVVFAIVPLVFVIGVLLIVLVYYVFRLGRAIALHNRTLGLLPVTVPEDTASLQNVFTGAESGARALRFDSRNPPYTSEDVDERRVPETTDFMVRTAALWAQAILSGSLQRQRSRHPRGPSSRSDKYNLPVSIPIREALVVVNPAGDKNLGITSEIVLKDACLRVTEQDLFNWQSSLPFANQSDTISEVSDPAGNTEGCCVVSSIDSKGRAEEGNNLREKKPALDNVHEIRSHAIDVLNISRSATEQSRQHPSSRARNNSGRRSRHKRRRRNTCDAACQTDDL